MENLAAVRINDYSNCSTRKRLHYSDMVFFSMQNNDIKWFKMENGNYTENSITVMLTIQDTFDPMSEQRKPKNE